MNDSLNPVWNQTFDFVVEDGLHDMLIVEVWDHDTFGKVGVSSFSVISFILSKDYITWTLFSPPPCVGTCVGLGMCHGSNIFVSHKTRIARQKVP